MKLVHACAFLLSCLTALVLLAGQTQRLESPDQTPEGLSSADWASIRAAYAAGRPAFALTERGRQARNAATTDPVARQAYLKASNTGAEDHFGYSVAVSGDTVVIGAPYEDSQATGVNGNHADNSAEDAGAAYVFVRNGTTWTQQAYLKASNTGKGDQFGISVAVSGDTVVVGAATEDSNATGVNGTGTDSSIFYDAGAVYVFVRNGTAWTQQAYLKASNTGAGDFFGSSVAVSGDTVIVGAFFESSNATGVNSNQADNSAYSAGAAYVFVRSGTTWTQQAYLKASNTGNADLFGFSVAVSGDTVVVGAYGESSNATGVNGNQADNSVGYAGAAYVFVRSGTTWAQEDYLKASNTGTHWRFGFSVAVAGDTVVVGAPLESSHTTGINGNQADNSAFGAGAAYVFTRSGTTWTQEAYLKASNTAADGQFGTSVAVAGDTVVIGAPGESSNATGVNGNQANNSVTTAGAAYVFVRGGTTWAQQAYLKASNTDIGDRFGDSVAVAGDMVVVGARGESSKAIGINGNPGNNLARQAGAAYMFTVLVPAIARNDNVFVLRFPGEPGLSYRVQYTTGLVAPQVWNEFTPPAIYTAAPSGIVTHTDVNPPDSLRLYRALANP